MKWLQILLMAATAASSGCVLHHPGSQTLVINPFDKDGWVRPANAEGNAFWREATGERYWGEGEPHWLTR